MIAIPWTRRAPPARAAPGVSLSKAAAVHFAGGVVAAFMLTTRAGVLVKDALCCPQAMCRPIRELTQMKGFDCGSHVLACFGGAGGQHACAIARSLGMQTVFCHRYASVLSAVGIGLAQVVAEAQEPAALRLGPAAQAALEPRLAALEARVRASLAAQGLPAAGVVCERFLNLRRA